MKKFALLTTTLQIITVFIKTNSFAHLYRDSTDQQKKISQQEVQELQLAMLVWSYAAGKVGLQLD